VYDLAERAIPSPLRDQDLDGETCARLLVKSAVVAMGVATAKDIAAYHGFAVKTVQSVLSSTNLRRVNVEGWRETAYLSEHAEAGLQANLRGRTVLLSPFDSLLWDRARLERLFNVTYRLEAYVPAPKRVVGYFAMPVLSNERIVGLVDPKRVGTTLHARHVVVHEPRALDKIASALREAASWVGCDTVSIERVSPPQLSSMLKGTLKVL
jgi:uncharacterized protein YcaQ